MSRYYMTENDYLMHHGVKGQKWGLRQWQNEDGSLTPAGREHYGYGSARGNFHRGLSKIYALNEKTYNKLGNKTLASLNKAYKESQLKKASEADRKKIEKDRIKQEERDRKVDPSIAKNKETQRVAYDYHNLSDRDFKAKYQTSKDVFAKRYEKTQGDTYKSGLKKAAIATMINAMLPTAKTPYYDFKSGRIKTIETGRKTALKTLAKDTAYSEIVTRVGFDKAEKLYNASK